MPLTSQPRGSSVRTVKTAGLVLGAVLVGALMAIAWVDRHVQITDSGRDDLWSWWLTVGWGVALFAGYCMGLAYVLRVLHRSDAGHTRLIEGLDASERKFRQMFEKNPLPFWVYEAETLAFLEVNEAAVRQYGYSREEFLGMTILGIRPEEQHAALIAYTRRPTGSGPDEPRVWTHQRKDGSTLDVRIHSSETDFRGRRAFLILAEDITEQLSQERELAYRATHDPCTGLLNGRALADTLQSQDSTAWRLACVQLRGLELVEDSLGEQAATLLLQRMARRLERLGQAYGEVGHVRREEFVLAIRDPGKRWDEAWLQLRDELARPIAGTDSRQQLESWVGTAEFPGDHPDAMEALHLAALAAHLAKAEGRPLIAFEAPMARQAGQRLRMAARVHRALEQSEFELHFQPIRDVARGCTVGLEALVRWPQPEGGYTPPAEFIGVCEDTGLIVPLGRWVLREAAKAQCILRAAGHGGLSIAVNVSQAQFLNNDLTRDFDEVIQEFALSRGALHIELTESILMTRPEQALAILRQLQDRGICVSLDDFGTGFSSMAYLRHLPIDAMKIDRAFVRNVHDDRRNASICQALLSLGHSLELTVVAEGVEEQAEYDWLRDNHCDQAQGYCLGRPAPLDAVIPAL